MRDELQKLVNTLNALCPSRNYISQYLLLVPKDYPTIHDLFPEFLSDVEVREDLKKILGIDYGYQVSASGDTLSNHLRNFLFKLFDLMENPTLRESLCKLLGVSDNALFNPRLEWIRARVNGVKSDKKDGPTSIKILQVLASTEEPYEYWRLNEDLRKKVGGEDEQYKKSLKLCEDLYLVTTQSQAGKPGYVLSNELIKYLDTVKEIIES